MVGLCVQDMICALKQTTRGKQIARALLSRDDKRWSLPWLAVKCCIDRKAAIRHGRTLSKDPVHRSCWYAQTLTQLLQADDYVIWSLDSSAIHTPCLGCLYAVAYGLRDRRHRLKDLALQQLPPSLIRTFALDQDILLNRFASAVTDALLAMGCDVPLGHQKGICHGVLMSQFDNIKSSRWLFEILFDVGFRDIDAPDALGTTSLQRITAKLMTDQKAYFDLCHWAIKNGADVFRPLLSWVTISPPNSRPLWRPQLLDEILKRSEELDIRLIHVLAFLNRKCRYPDSEPLRWPLNMKIGDASTCSCGPVYGWDPFTYYLALTISHHTLFCDAHDVSEIAAAAQEVFSNTNRWLSAPQYRTAFRFTTHAFSGTKTSGMAAIAKVIETATAMVAASSTVPHPKTLVRQELPSSSGSCASSTFSLRQPSFLVSCDIHLKKLILVRRISQPTGFLTLGPIPTAVMTG